MGSDYLEELSQRVLAYAKDIGKPISTELLIAVPELRTVRDWAIQQTTLPSLAPCAEKDILDCMRSNPGLQQPLANLVDYVPSKWLLEQEAPTLCKVRAVHGGDCKPWPPDLTDPKRPATVYDWARLEKLSGLCLSGGGIRSATFNLGVLQGLASKQKLNDYDYLSSVSGGGYIHAWLVAWLKRETARQRLGRNSCFACKEALKEVQAAMSPIPASTNCIPNRKSPEDDPKYDASIQRSLPPQRAPFEIRWLRSYSNYLTPEKGLFTLDTWTAIAIWIRNTLLNQIVLISALLFMLLIPWLFSVPWADPGSACTKRETTQPASIAGHFAATGPGVQGQYTFAISGLAKGAASGIAAETFSHHYGCTLRYSVASWAGKRLDLSGCPRLNLCNALSQPQQAPCNARVLQKNQKSLFWIVSGLILFLVGAFYLALLLSDEHSYIRACDQAVRASTAPGTIPPCPGPLADVLDCERKTRRKSSHPWDTSFILALLMFPAIPLSYAFVSADPSAWQYAGVAGALFLLSMGVALGGRALPRYGLWARLGFSALCSLVSLGGAAVFALLAVLIRVATLEHWGARWMHCPVPGIELIFGVPLLASIPFLTVGLLVGAVGRQFDDWIRELLGRLQASTLLIALAWLGLFSIALLSPDFLTSVIYSSALKWSTVLAWAATTAASVASGKSAKTDGAAADAPKTKTALSAELLATVGPYVYILGLLVLLSWTIELWLGSGSHPWRLGSGLLVSFLASLTFGWRLNANAFSMFPFYRNRLTRCYLGASNRSRDPNPLTGFDDRDTRGLQLRCLTPGSGLSRPLPHLLRHPEPDYGQGPRLSGAQRRLLRLHPALYGIHGKLDGGRAGHAVQRLRAYRALCCPRRGSEYLNGYGNLRCRPQSQLGLPHETGNGLPADHVQRSPRLLATQPAQAVLRRTETRRCAKRERRFGLAHGSGALLGAHRKHRRQL